MLSSNIILDLGKCGVLACPQTTTRNQIKFDVMGEHVPSIQSVKYLGPSLTSSLNCEKNVEYFVKKKNKGKTANNEEGVQSFRELHPKILMD